MGKTFLEVGKKKKFHKEPSSGQIVRKVGKSALDSELGGEINHSLLGLVMIGICQHLMIPLIYESVMLKNMTLP